VATSWRYVTDGGIETDLIFNHGVDLPEFAAYPLVRTDEGRALLRTYYEGYLRIAEVAGAGLRLESPTWRANPDWGALLGDDARTTGRRSSSCATWRVSGATGSQRSGSSGRSGHAGAVTHRAVRRVPTRPLSTTRPRSGRSRRPEPTRSRP
jgi:homocysteine S-methyltransferase